MSPRFTRRAFVKHSALAAATALPLSQILAQTPTASKDGGPASANGGGGGQLDGPGALVHWLEAAAGTEPVGVTWGIPWKQGEHARNAAFALRGPNGSSLPLQSWPLAYWPDGSLKWTAHAAVLGPKAGEPLQVVAAPHAVLPSSGIRVETTASEFVVDTGILRCRVARQGAVLITSLVREGREVAKDGRLVGLRQDQPDLVESATLQQHAFTGETESAVVEQSGPIRAVIKLEGKHRESDGRAWLPFSVRLYFYAGSEAVRVVHAFIFDGDEKRDFIRGLGVRFAVPMRDALQDRHIRFAGKGKGLWAEAVRPLTGLRRDAGSNARTAQVEGKGTPKPDQLPEIVGRHLDVIPSWGDFTLAQLSADGFQIKKRTKAGHGWIPAGAGHRASGLGYVGGVSGGLVFGQRDFWQRHPTQLDIRNANTDSAEATAWLWSPEAPAMDLRFYHDGLGMTDYDKQNEGLDITYEDYEPGFGTPLGTARSNELMFWAVAATPSRDRLAEMTAGLRLPPLLVCDPRYYLKTGVFGALWSLPAEGGGDLQREIEARQNFLIKFYEGQVEQRRWYGFWDYGDVMHTYDADRHVWRYDIGGYAWDNSELSPDLWLWLSYLRTGRADIFRLAEAMTRHTGEVDVHHLGPYKGLGSRHNVQHWGCSAKQVRVSNAAYRRYYYYLTGDERVGDLLTELVDSHHAYLTLLPTRKVPGRTHPEPPGPEGKAAYVSVGTDFGAIAAAWLAEWERTGEAKCRDRLVNALTTIATMPKGFFSGGGMMDVSTGAFLAGTSPDRVNISHLNAVFGLVEVCAELNQLLNVPEFDRAWLDYCEMYNASEDELKKRFGEVPAGRNLTQAHSRLTAYVAFRRKDAKLAARAWNEFLTARGELPNRSLQLHRLEGPQVLEPVDEAPGVSTNSTAQWGLAAIQLLAWIGEYIPKKAES